jgi:isopenicillin-N epimerase
MTTFGRPLLELWALDPAIVYLNHGTVGATPRRVLAAQQALRDEIERQPARFLLRELTAVRVGGERAEPPRLRAAATEVAPCFGAQGGDLVFVDNATTGANAVLRSFPFQPGDEIVVLDLAYGGVVAAARHAARARGASVRVLETPEPVRGPADLVAVFEAGLGARTRLALVDHITAESALVVPVVEIAALCRRRGVRVLVDGAHAPGAIELEMPALGADWYVGNLHKWAWAPRSSGILWAAPEAREGLHPAVVSWGLDQGFTAEFDLPGTRDPTAHLAAPAALAMMRELGFEAVRGWNHALAWRAACALAERWRTRFVTPESMIGTMATVPLPAALGADREAAARLRDALLFEDGIEVQVHAWRGRLHARISAQIYNEDADFERLGHAVESRAGLARSRSASCP